MNRKPPRTEAGQILVILVLALVGLLAFTALAIDGSMVFSDRRYDQSAADSAALAGAQAAAFDLRESYTQNSNTGTSIYFTCDLTNASFVWVQKAMGKVFAAVKARAATNHFTLTDSDVYSSLASLEAAKNGVFIECVASGVEPGIYVHVMLTNTVSTSLVHFVFGEIQNTVTAVAQATPAEPIAYGASIIALRTACPNNTDGGVQFQGVETVEIEGGGVFSNFCLFKNGASTVKVTGTIDPVTGEEVGGSILYNDGATYQSPGNPDCGPGTKIDPCPTQTSTQMNFDDVQSPNCDYYEEYTTWPGSKTPDKLSPGKYLKDPGITGNDSLTLDGPGLFCFYGGFTVGGNDPKDPTIPKLKGNGVTIAIMGGSMKITGGVKVVLSAPDPGAEPPAVPGMLIYQPPSNTSDMQVGGNTGSTMTGTIFAPKSQISFSGTSSVGSKNYGVQIIGDTVIVNGTPNIGIVYNRDNTFYDWPSVALSR